MPTAVGTAVSATIPNASAIGPSLAGDGHLQQADRDGDGDERGGVGEPPQLLALDPRGAPQPGPHRDDGADEGADRAERAEAERHADGGVGHAGERPRRRRRTGR